MKTPIKSSKPTIIFIAITATIGWFCWEAGKSYGRQQESKVINLARNMQRYDTEWLALYHLSILDYDAALSHQRRKFDKALEMIESSETDGVDPNLKWYYVDRIAEQHPGRINELLILNELQKDRINKKTEAEQIAPSSNH